MCHVTSPCTAGYAEQSRRLLTAEERLVCAAAAAAAAAARALPPPVCPFVFRSCGVSSPKSKSATKPVV